MHLGRPVDADEPPIRFVLLCQCLPPFGRGGSRPPAVFRHPCTGALSATPHWACTTVHLVEAQVPSWRLEALGAAGRSRRGGRRFLRCLSGATLLHTRSPTGSR